MRTEQLPWSHSSWRQRGPWRSYFKYAPGKFILILFRQLPGITDTIYQVLASIYAWAMTKADESHSYIAYMFTLFRNENHPIFTCWDGVLWLDTWKRTVIYTILAILLFAQPHRAWFSTIAGLTLIALAFLHASRFNCTLYCAINAFEFTPYATSISPGGINQRSEELV